MLKCIVAAIRGCKTGPKQIHFGLAGIRGYIFGEGGKDVRSGAENIRDMQSSDHW